MKRTQFKSKTLACFEEKIKKISVKSNYLQKLSECQKGIFDYILCYKKGTDNFITSMHIKLNESDQELNPNEKALIKTFR